MTQNHDETKNTSSFDHTTHSGFYEYYSNASQSAATAQRFRSVQATMLRVAKQTGMPAQLDVADIGCGAGTQCRMWAELGHRVRGLDVNEPLINLARERARQDGLDIRFEVGSATALPWEDSSVDVCLLPELLEHVSDWRSCLKEAARVLRPKGLLYLSTTNVLCPKQEEFSLPLYSWYPAPVKRYCERLAITTRPKIASFAKYPAVNWFSFYSLRDFLEGLGFDCRDRFDLVDTVDKGALARFAVRLARGSELMRFLGHVASQNTRLVALKR